MWHDRRLARDDNGSSAIGYAAIEQGSGCRRCHRTAVSQGFDLPLIAPKVNSIDSPGFIHSQQSGIVRRERVRPGTLRPRRPGQNTRVPRYSPNATIFPQEPTICSSLYMSFGLRTRSTSSAYERRDRCLSAPFASQDQRACRRCHS
jgi:hypothetical protein